MKYPVKPLHIVIGLIVAALVIIYFVGLPSNWSFKVDGFTDGGSGSNPKLTMYYVDWCPHCTKAKPEWTSFKNAFGGKETNGFKIICNEVDCTETNTTNSPLIQKFGVDSFPTVKMVKADKQIAFDSRITNDTLTKFVTTMLN
jgi:thiol-disulfide isomerase/thioredoxin